MDKFSDNSAWDKNISSAAGKADAIAVRILENPNHYNPARWYRKQGFKGKPTKLTIDGYRAVRSGRTTYVNVGNVDGSGDLHTYIYLLSYNQNIEPVTKTIYKRIINNWKFNTNLGTNGQCEISSFVCQEDGDCPRDYTCQTSGSQEDKCLPSEIPLCTADKDCPSGLYCNNEKSRVARDTWRLGDIAEITFLLERYKQEHNGKYPKLQAGTYWPGKTVSVWPSWQKELGQALGGKIPEPKINVLGACNIDCCSGSCSGNQVCNYDFDPKTCWDDVQKWFSDPTPFSNDQFNLPTNSFAYVYENTGSGYNLCAPTESSYIPGSGGSGACSALGIGTSGTAANDAPQINCGSLSGFPDEAFDGYAEADDPDGDAIVSWSLDTSVTSAWTGWSDLPHIQGSGNSEIVQIHSDDSGVEGDYDIELTATDSQGNSSTGVCTIHINGGLPEVDPVTPQSVVIGETMEFMVTASEPTNQYPLNFNFNAPGYNISHSLMNGHDAHVDQVFTETGCLTPDNQTNTHSVSVSATDSNGDTSPTISFDITVVNNPPTVDIPSNCSTEIRNNTPYSDCEVDASDPDGHAIANYSASGLPSGMSIDSTDGTISGTPNNPGSYSVSVTTEDEYGAVSEEATLNIQVNTYCGDGSVQDPNSEGRGGDSNTGDEDCDGPGSVATNPAASSENYEYDCTTPPNDCPEPGNGSCANTCTFTGGYCGDGSIQQEYGEQCEGANGVLGGDPAGCSSSCQCQAPYSWAGTDCRYLCSPFNFMEDWNWEPNPSLANSDYGHVMMTPIVANLDGDNSSEIIFNAFNDDSQTWRTAILRVIDGSTGQEEWQSSTLVSGGAQISTGDINNDGYNEVITMEYTGSGYRPIAFTHNGSILWRADPNVNCRTPSIADLDQDGNPEVVCRDFILNGADGSKKTTGGSPWISNGGTAVANIDMSGGPEILNGCSAVSFNGTSFTTLWNVCSSYPTGEVAVGNIDISDSYPEIVSVRGGRHETVRENGTTIINPEYSTVALFDHQGNQLWRVDIPYQVGSSGGGCVSYYNKDTGANNRSSCHHYGGGPPTIADFDQDGEAEIGVAAADYYVVFESDGSVLWTHSNQDYSSAGTGSSVFDFDYNNQAEVLYADEEHFRIFSGNDGSLLYEVNNNSATLREYPVVADIDDDERVEIVIAQNCYSGGSPASCSGIRVFGNADPASCDFPNTRTIWNQHSYHITNIANDGSIPRVETNNWEMFNSWRQNIMDFTATWCGDGRCDSGENSATCSLDCP